MTTLAFFPAPYAAAATALVACGCATAHSAMPGAAELGQALFAHCQQDPPERRDVRCRGFEEEPTEFSCTFGLRHPEGRWTRAAATIAIDGSHWISIDGTDHCHPASTRID